MEVEVDRGGSVSMESIDIISRLPDEIRELILGYLPITDVVKTSVLSPKWRDSWTKVVQMNLLFDPTAIVEKDIFPDKYCRIIGKILLSHVGSVRKCVIHSFMDDNEERDGTKGWAFLKGDMKAWLKWLSRKGIEDLTVHLKKGLYGDEADESDIQNFELPRSIFYCLELSCLSLERFIFTSSDAFRGFPNLVKLELNDTHIVGDILERIISSCLLETLVVINCIFTTRETAISSTSLKIFKFVRTPQENFPLILKFTPNLRVASFLMGGTDYDEEFDLLYSNCFHLFGCIPKIEELTFDCRLHETADTYIITTKLPMLLVDLKTLTLNGMDACSDDDMSFLFCLIRSSPNLKNLTVHLESLSYSQYNEHLKLVAKLLEAQDINEIKSKITTLSVAFSHYYTYDKSDRIEAIIALIDGLVSCCPDLVKLYIKSPKFLGVSADRKLSNALPTFAKNSSKPTIIIHTKVRPS